MDTTVLVTVAAGRDVTDSVVVMTTMTPAEVLVNVETTPVAAT